MSVVKAHGVTDGRFGVRGFRAHCPDCGYLSDVKRGYRGAGALMEAHRCQVSESNYPRFSDRRGPGRYRLP